MKFSCVKPVKIKEDKRFRERKKKKHLHDLYVHNQKLLVITFLPFLAF